MSKLPVQYQSLQQRFRGVLKAIDALGRKTKTAGPLNRKTAELIQLAAAAAIRSEGSVHSHARRETRRDTPCIDPFDKHNRVPDCFGRPFVDGGCLDRSPEELILSGRSSP
jgi:hypothetical protein